MTVLLIPFSWEVATVPCNHCLMLRKLGSI